MDKTHEEIARAAWSGLMAERAADKAEIERLTLRLDDALHDKDEIYAVIKGFATNNYGANKVGYTAPSVNGQAEVIATAQAMGATFRHSWTRFCSVCPQAVHPVPGTSTAAMA